MFNTVREKKQAEIELNGEMATDFNNMWQDDEYNPDADEW
jgi:hypothetical protein